MTIQINKLTASMIFIFLVTSLFPVFGSYETIPESGKTQGMGNALVAFPLGPENLFFNPAGIALIEHSSLVFSNTQLYGMKELTSRWAAGILASPFGKWGLALHRLGDPVYAENTLALGSGFRIRKQHALGLALRLLRLDIAGYGSAQAVLLDAGFQSQITKTVSLGGSVSNFSGRQIGRRKESLPRIFRVGAGWEPAEGVRCAAEWDKDSIFPGAFKAGMEYKILTVLTLRSGFEHRPSFFTFGFGTSWKNISLDYGSSFHPELGLTHVLSILLEPE